MGFVISSGGSGGSGGGDVLSVNGKVGHVFLRASDLNALESLGGTLGGIMAGIESDMPSSPKENTLFITLDKKPNVIKLYTSGEWETLGGEENNEPIKAVEVVFDGSIIDEYYTTVEEAIVGESLKQKDTRNLVDIHYLEFTNRVENLEKDKGKVKLSSIDTLGYLAEKVDGSTITIVEDKMQVQRLDGQLVTIGEVNYLQGAKSNLQEQINNLGRLGGFQKVVKTFAELGDIEDPKSGDVVLVSHDETHDNKITFYLYENSQWSFVGEFYAEVRDFTTNPINLSTETTGVLDERNIDSKIMRKSDLEVLIPRTTDDIVEGVNLYFTNQRVSDNIDVRANTQNRHKHDNLSFLNNFGEDEKGNLVYKGKPLEAKSKVEWGEF